MSLRTRPTTPTLLSPQWSDVALSRSSRPNAIVSGNASTTRIFTKNGTWLSAFPASSKTFGASQPATKSWRKHSSPWSPSHSASSGYGNLETGLILRQIVRVYFQESHGKFGISFDEFNIPKIGLKLEQFVLPWDCPGKQILFTIS